MHWSFRFFFNQLWGSWRKNNTQIASDLSIDNRVVVMGVIAINLMWNSCTWSHSRQQLWPLGTLVSLSSNAPLPQVGPRSPFMRRVCLDESYGSKQRFFPPFNAPPPLQILQTGWRFVIYHNYPHVCFNCCQSYIISGWLDSCWRSLNQTSCTR